MSTAPTATTKETEFSYPADEPIAIITHTFKAPRELVWRCCTEPEHYRNWWGPRDYETTKCEMDVRPGGEWRMSHKGTDGVEYQFLGKYIDVVRPELLSYTFGMEGMFEDKTIIESITFTAIDEHTTLLTNTSRYDGFEDRDGMVATGMEWGARQSMERLGELLARLA